MGSNTGETGGGVVQFSNDLASFPPAVIGGVHPEPQKESYGDAKHRADLPHVLVKMITEQLLNDDDSGGVGKGQCQKGSSDLHKLPVSVTF